MPVRGVLAIDCNNSRLSDLSTAGVHRGASLPNVKRFVPVPERRSTLRFLSSVQLGTLTLGLCLAWAPLSARAQETEPLGVTTMSDATPAAEPLASAIKTRPSKAVFGYLRSSDTTDNLRYDLLTHIACFSVGARTDGSISNGIGWPTAAPFNSVIANAHPNGVKVILCVTGGSPADLATLMSSNTAMDAFNVNIKALLLAGDADGVNIDFEGANTSGWRGMINNFMCRLTTYLHQEIPGSEVSFAGPAVNWGGWDFPGLAACCDYIFIMGYDFYGQTSGTSGPSSPLTPPTTGAKCVTNTIDVQYANVPRSKLILGIPYYGNHWTTNTSAAYSTRIAWQSPAIRFYAEESAIYGVQWDSNSQTPWYRYQVGATWHQVWFDNAQSLALKYDFADNRGLKGIGMWALNYDLTRTELWDLIDSRYGGTYASIPNFDGDRDVDLEDFGAFQRCMTGPNVAQRDPTCAKAMLDGDLDVDNDDLAVFVKCMGGPNGSTDYTCTH
jgi:spore germination protein YaaH